MCGKDYEHHDNILCLVNKNIQSMKQWFSVTKNWVTFKSEANVQEHAAHAPLSFSVISLSLSPEDLHKLENTPFTGFRAAKMLSNVLATLRSLSVCGSLLVIEETYW